MKKLLALFMAVLMVFALAGCSPAKKAEKAVAGYLDALKELDIEKAASYTGEEAGADTVFNDETAVFAESLVKRITYEITGSEAIDENTVKVNVSITNVDMKPVLGEFMVKALQYTFAAMESGEETDDGEVTAKYAEIMEECLNKEGLETVTFDVTVTVALTDGKWIVEADSIFLNAILGGMSDAAKELKSSMGL